MTHLGYLLVGWGTTLAVGGVYAAVVGSRPGFRRRGVAG